MWTPPTELPDRLYGPVAVDFEGRDDYLKTRGPGWCFKHNHDHGPVGVAIRSDNFSGYLPWGHQEGGNMDPDLVQSWFAHQMKDESTPKIFANGLYDVGWSRRKGWTIRGEIHDVLIMAALLDENRGRAGYGLDAVATDFAGFSKDETKLIAEGAKRGYKKMSEIKANMWRFHSSVVGEYAEADGEATYQAFKVMYPMMQEQDLLQIYALEQEQLPILLDMRFRGVRLDLDHIERCVKEFASQEKQLLEEIKKMTGIEVSLTSSASKAKAMRAQGFEPPKTEKTGKDSVTADWLEELNDPVAEMIVRASKIRKIKDDFLIKNLLEKQEDGRIYGNFHQLASEDGGTVGGRYSSSKPNLQNQPNPEKDPVLGTAVRQCFLPEEGELWASEDYSSQEPRLTVHYAYLTGQIGADKAVARYQENPRTDYHGLVAELAGITRKQAKPINLGLAYGMGEAKLCHDLGLPTVFQEFTYGKRKVIREVAGPEGAELLRRYHEGVPFLKGLMVEATKKAKNRGYIITLLGRRCRFPLVNGERWYTHKALNRLIQGSAADQTKKAMIDVFKAGFKILVQVHDELGVSVANQNEAMEVKRIMENCVKLSVPSVVDVALGPSWGDAKDIKEAA